MSRPLESLTYTVPEAAAVIGVSPETVRILIKRGELPALRIGRRVLIAKVALVSWVEANANTSFRGWAG